MKFREKEEATDFFSGLFTPLSIPRVSPEGLENFANYKYKSGEWSVLDYPFNHWWTWVSEQLPTWLAPNLITAIGTIAILSTIPLGWLLGYDSPVLNLIIALCVFFYQTLDAVDGKQARRTHSSSPLGQLFDHGCDALCTCVFVLNLCLSAQFSTTMSFAILSFALFCFFLGQWDEYYTHTLRTSFMGFGVTEAQVAVILFHLSMWLLPMESLLAYPLSFAFSTCETPPTCALSLTINIAVRDLIGFIGATVLLFGCIVQILQMMLRKEWRSLPPLAGPLLTILLSSLLLLESTSHLFTNGSGETLLKGNTFLIFLTFSFSMTLYTTEMIVFSMARDAYPLQRIWIGWLVLLVISYMDSTNFLVDYYLPVFALSVTLFYIAFCVYAIQDITTRLGIYAFTITSRRPSMSTGESTGGETDRKSRRSRGTSRSGSV